MIGKTNAVSGGGQKFGMIIIEPSMDVDLPTVRGTKSYNSTYRPKVNSTDNVTYETTSTKTNICVYRELSFSSSNVTSMPGITDAQYCYDSDFRAYDLKTALKTAISCIGTPSCTLNLVLIPRRSSSSSVVSSNDVCNTATVTIENGVVSNNSMTIAGPTSTTTHYALAYPDEPVNIWLYLKSITWSE